MGLLGPNGAGKTTTVRILTTLLDPDAGRATVVGLDVVAEARALRRVIGLSGQYAAVDEHLTGFENLDMVGRLYHLGRTRSRERARELLERFDLVEAADRPVEGLLRRHAAPARPGRRAGRRAAGAVPRRADDRARPAQPQRACGRSSPTWSPAGTTLLLTTQYLEEADRLADKIAVIDHGRVIAQGTADAAQDPGRRRADRVHPGRRRADRCRVRGAGLARVRRGRAPTQDARRVTVPVDGGAAVLVRRCAQLDAAGIAVQDVGAAPPDPGRRVPQPDRPRGRDRGRARPTTSRLRQADDPAGRTPPSRRRWRPDERHDRGRRRRDRHHQAEPDQDQAGARPARLHHPVADHVRAAVRLRVRQRDQRARRAATRSS